MKMIKTLGYTGLASAALLVLTPFLTVAATPHQEAQVTGESSSKSVHRVTHNLASAEKYTAAGSSSGYKWGQKPSATEQNNTWAADEEETRSGYKWGNSSTVVDLDRASSFAKQTRNPWGRRDFSEQARNPWGRRDFSEQARNPWGRRDFSEQARNPWGRRDFSEQARNPWGRRDFSEQARNPWGRRDFSEQARNPWGRRDFSEQARNPWGRR